MDAPDAPAPRNRSQPPPDDEALARRLHATFEKKLEGTGLKGGLHFYVQHGKVTIHGTVQHELDRQLILKVIRQMRGVKEVVDHLQLPSAQDQSES